MKTLTFKVEEEEARRLRAAARRAQLPLSEYLRRQIRKHTPANQPMARARCEHTGALIFAPATPLAPLNSETVREYLADFP